MIELGKARREFSAARTGSCKHHERTSGLYVRICPVTLIRYNSIDFVRIAFGRTVDIHLYASVFKFLLVSKRALLVGKHSDYNAVDVYAHSGYIVNHPLHFAAVRNAVVGADFVALYSVCVYANDKFRLIAQFLQKFDFCRFIETGQHSCRVQIVKEFSAEFEIEFVKAVYSFKNMLRLFLHIQVAVKSDFVHMFTFCILIGLILFSVVDRSY